MGELQQMMNYILIGLLDRAIPETFDQMYKIKLDKPTNATYTITTKLLDCLEALSKKDIEDAEDAIKDLNKGTKPGQGREGVLALMAHFGMKADAKVPALEALNRHAEVKAFAEAAGNASAEDDLGI